MDKVIRTVDADGLLKVPKSIIRAANFTPYTEVEFSIDGEGTVTLKKYLPLNDYYECLTNIYEHIEEEIPEISPEVLNRITDCIASIDNERKAVYGVD